MFDFLSMTVGEKTVTILQQINFHNDTDFGFEVVNFSLYYKSLQFPLRLQRKKKR